MCTQMSVFIPVFASVAVGILALAGKQWFMPLSLVSPSFILLGRCFQTCVVGVHPFVYACVSLKPKEGIWIFGKEVLSTSVFLHLAFRVKLNCKRHFITHLTICIPNMHHHIIKNILALCMNIRSSPQTSDVIIFSVFYTLRFKGG